MKTKVAAVTIALMAGLLLAVSTTTALQEGPSAQVYVHKFVIPRYSPMARLAHIQGDASALVHISGDGRVEGLSDLEGSPFLRGALDALKDWEFILPEGKPTAIRITFRFVLSGPEQKEMVVTEVRGTLPTLVEIVTNPTSEKPGPDVVPDTRPRKP